MADYRDWCGECGNEVNFGSHKAGCAYVASVAQAKAERHEAEDAAFREYDKKTDEEILQELLELNMDRIALDQELARVTRKGEFLRQYMFMERQSWKMNDEFKKMLEERGFRGRWF